MALYLKVRDNRFQFSFGSKYMVIADVMADTGTPYVQGGTTILLAQDPQVKASRAPIFSVFSSVTPSLAASYRPSDYSSNPPNPPSTVLANVNLGTLIIYNAGSELPGGTDLGTIFTTAGLLSAMLIFQGME